MNHATLDELTVEPGNESAPAADAGRRAAAGSRPTLRDVAQMAGVSPTTVSLYLNGATQVCSPETARRIREAINELSYTRGLNALKSRDLMLDEMGARDHVQAERLQADRSVAPRKAAAASATVYRPQVGAAAVAPPQTQTEATARRAALAALGRKVRTLGIALPASFCGADPAEMAHRSLSDLADQVWNGASEMAEFEEFRLLSFSQRVRNSPSAAPFLDGSIAGLILAPGYNDPRLPELVESGLPVVLLNRFLEIPDGCGAVYPMENDTVELALSYLWERGHRRIAHYAGPVADEQIDGRIQSTLRDAARDGITEPMSAIQHLPSDLATRRFERYVVWTRMRHADDDDLVVVEESWDGESAGAALSHWLSLPEPPTAVFCASDTLALALWEAAHKMNVRIPDDLSLIGVGDSREARLLGRPLTSVALPGEEIGKEAVRLLLRMIEGIPAAACRRAVPVTRLVERHSVAFRNAD